MAETQHGDHVHSEGHAEGGHGNLFKLYMVVALALAVFTSLSFVANEGYRQQYISVLVSFAIILAVAIVKATLVATYFMHLKWDWPLLYFLILPAFVLATMMMVVLLPDIVFAWHNDGAIYSPADGASQP